MKTKNFEFKIIAGFYILFCLLISISTVGAQTGKTRKKIPVAAPVAAPTQAQTLPVIISRAEDIPSENNVVVSEPIAQPPADTIEEKLGASNEKIKELNRRLKSLESTQKNEYDEKQKRLLLNLDILTRSEQRADALRKQLFEIIEKESAVKSRVDQLTIDARPENLERSSAFSGSLRPEEIRDQRKKSVDAERKNLEDLLTQIQNNRAVLEINVQKADSLVEKIRAKMEKDIDDALTTDDGPKQ